MPALVVLSSAAHAEALIQIGDRFRGDQALIIVCCLHDTIEDSPRPIASGRGDHLGIADAAFHAIHSRDIPAAIYRLNHPDPASALVGFIQRRDIDIVIADAAPSAEFSTQQASIGTRLMRSAPSRVALFDLGSRPTESISNVVVLSGGTFGQHAIYEADLLAGEHGAVNAVHIGSAFGDVSRAAAGRQLDREIGNLPRKLAKRIGQKVVLAERNEAGLAQAGRDADLVLFGATSTRAIDRIREHEHATRPDQPGPIIGIVRPARDRPDTLLASLIDRAVYWIPKLEPEDRIDLHDRIQLGSKWNPDFGIMMGAAAAIATLGLLLGSPAVVIGAMLVAPLMTPLIAAGLALVQGNLPLFRDSVRTIVFGVGLALIVSVVIAGLVPQSDLTLEAKARAAPSVLDFGVAFIAGIAAAYAMSRPDVVAAVAGVAIASALVPPLATVGIGISRGDMGVAQGASILLLANIVAIVLGAATIFRLLGVHGTAFGVGARLWVRRTVLTLLLLTALLLIPLGLGTAEQLAEGQTRPMAYPVSRPLADAINDFVDTVPGVHVVLAGRPGTPGHDSPDVGVILSSDRPIPPSLVKDLKAIVAEVRGEDVHVSVIVLREAGLEHIAPPPESDEITPDQIPVPDTETRVIRPDVVKPKVVEPNRNQSPGG